MNTDTGGKEAWGLSYSEGVWEGEGQGPRLKLRGSLWGHDPGRAQARPAPCLSPHHPHASPV